MTLGPTANSAGAAQKRLDKAVRTCHELQSLRKAPIAGKRAHPAWRLLAGVVNHCLVYDASVNDPGTMVPLSRQLDEVVGSTAAAILGIQEISPRTLMQIRLSRDQGGCGLRSAEDRSYTAFLAALLRIMPAWPEPAIPDEMMPAVRSALDGLRSLGVELDQHGMPHAAWNPPSIVFDPVHHTKIPKPKRQRVWWQLIEKARAEALSQPTREDAKRIRSCGGPEGGAFLVATRDEGAHRLSDNIFVTAVLYRLGAQVMPQGTCQHTTQTQGATKRTCLHPAGRDGHHAVLCKVGGAPCAAHSEGCHILFQASQKAGFQSRHEQVIPELATEECLSPQLDVEGWGLLGQERLLIDFTIRHPLAQRYANTDQPTEQADSEKARQYRTPAGIDCASCVHGGVWQAWK